MLKKTGIMAVVLMIAIMATWLIGTQTAADTATPGTVNDPLVTRSYVDKKVGELQTTLTEMMDNLGVEPILPETTTSADDQEIEAGSGVSLADVVTLIDAKIAALGDGNSNDSSEGSEANLLFQVIEAENGQRLICGASAEVILRAGSATVIAGINGDGLADLTSGVDLVGGEEVPKQHHLLISRDDGRGLLITSEATSYILIKGDYTLE